MVVGLTGAGHLAGDHRQIAGPEARVRRPNLLQAWGFVGTLG